MKPAVAGDEKRTVLEAVTPARSKGKASMTMAGLESGNTAGIKARHHANFRGRMKITRVIALTEEQVAEQRAALQDIELRKDELRAAERRLLEWEDKNFPVERKTRDKPHADDEGRQFIGAFVVFTSPYGGS